MNINDVKDIMQQFDSSSIREFAWQTGADSLTLSKNKLSSNLTTPSQPAVTPQSPVKSAESPVAIATAEVEGQLVTSPLVGVAYTKPAPDKPDFVAPGSAVKKGQTLLIIEAMKVMNEIPSPADGVVAELLVKSDDDIQYGQPLVRIK